MAPKKSGGFIAKKYGPLSGGAWLGVTGGVIGAYIIIRRYAAARAAAAQQSSTSTTGGNTIPAGQAAGTTPSTTTAATTAPTDLASWTEAALKYAPRDPIAGLNAIQNWMSGNCVDGAGYRSISDAIRHIGLPPYMQAFPVLTVCPGAAAPPPPPATTTTPPPNPPVPVVIPPAPIPPQVTPPPTLPNGSTTTPLALTLRDLTLVGQAKAAGPSDPSAFWANFGALALDFQNNPGEAAQVLAIEKQQPPTSILSPAYKPPA